MSCFGSHLEWPEGGSNLCLPQETPKWGRSCQEASEPAQEGMDLGSVVPAEPCGWGSPQEVFPFQDSWGLSKGECMQTKEKLFSMAWLMAVQNDPKKAIQKSGISLAQLWLINQDNYQAHTTKHIFASIQKYPHFLSLCLQRQELRENKSVCVIRLLSPGSEWAWDNYIFLFMLPSSPAPLGITGAGCNVTTTIPAGAVRAPLWNKPVGNRVWLPSTQTHSIRILAKCLCRDLCHSLERTWLFLWSLKACFWSVLWKNGLVCHVKTCFRNFQFSCPAIFPHASPEDGAFSTTGKQRWSTTVTKWAQVQDFWSAADWCHDCIYLILSV